MFQNVSELFTSEPVYRLGYRLDDRSSIPGEASDGIFSLRLHVQTGSGDHPATSPVGTGGGALSLWVKLPGREAEHSPPSNSEVMNSCRYTSITPVRLSGVVLS